MAVATNVEKRIQRLIQLAAKELRLEAVYLFGSTAKGKAHEWSDIDLAIVSPDFTGDSFEDCNKLFPTYCRWILLLKFIHSVPKILLQIIHLSKRS